MSGGQTVRPGVMFGLYVLLRGHRSAVSKHLPSYCTVWIMGDCMSLLCHIIWDQNSISVCLFVCNAGEQIRKRRCKAAFSYAPQHEDELELKAGDVIEIITEVRCTLQSIPVF